MSGSLAVGRLTPLGVLLAGTVILTAGSAFGQTMQVRLGAQAGVNLARSPYDLPGLDDATAKDSYRAGLSGGVTMTLVFPGQTLFSHEMGLVVQEKGGRTRFTYRSADPAREPPYEYEWRLTYLTVPLLAKASFSTRGVRPYVKAGAEAALLLAASMVERYRREDGSGSYEIDREIADWLGTGDIGLVLGAGTEIPLGPAAGFVEVSYVYGLTDVLEQEGLYSDEQLHNRVIGITVGIRL
jgi:hypothetical protein